MSILYRSKGRIKIDELLLFLGKRTAGTIYKLSHQPVLKGHGFKACPERNRRTPRRAVKNKEF
jgi:hypothetical protein